MKIAAVSQRVDEHRDRNETRDALDQKLVEFLSQAGLLSVPVPNALINWNFADAERCDTLLAWLSRLKPDGVVLSGGNSVGQSELRDATERQLCEYAKQNKLPLFAICRGMQFLGVLDGGELKQIDGHVGGKHLLLGELSGNVNSYHDFALVKCPRSYRALAFSEDGALEAMHHRELPWEAWMWHPERENGFHERDITRVKSLFKS